MVYINNFFYFFSYVRRFEPELAYLAMSPVESARTLAQCLSQLHSVNDWKAVVNRIVNILYFQFVMCHLVFLFGALWKISFDCSLVLIVISIICECSTALYHKRGDLSEASEKPSLLKDLVTLIKVGATLFKPVVV